MASYALRLFHSSATSVNLLSIAQEVKESCWHAGSFVTFAVRAFTAEEVVPVGAGVKVMAKWAKRAALANFNFLSRMCLCVRAVRSSSPLSVADCNQPHSLALVL